MRLFDAVQFIHSRRSEQFHFTQHVANKNAGRNISGIIEILQKGDPVGIVDQRLAMLLQYEDTDDNDLNIVVSFTRNDVDVVTVFPSDVKRRIKQW